MSLGNEEVKTAWKRIKLGAIDLDASNEGNYVVKYVTSSICADSSTFNITIGNTATINGAYQRSATINLLMTDITYSTIGATGISDDGVAGANGLPAGVSASWSADVITISGTPTALGTFNYTITLTCC